MAGRPDRGGYAARWAALAAVVEPDAGRFGQELEKRGHCFVRYADDCNVYVRSQRAGERVMADFVAEVR